MLVLFFKHMYRVASLYGISVVLVLLLMLLLLLCFHCQGHYYYSASNLFWLA